MNTFIFVRANCDDSCACPADCACHEGKACTCPADCGCRTDGTCSC